MFFSSVLFTKRGNLAKVWLAAHHQDKRLTKAIVVSTNIEECSHELSEPTVPLSLRISGQLLLGVVRIYQRKVRYLQEDTQEALTKVRMTSRPGSGALELHPSNATATASHITFMDSNDNDFLDFAIPDIPLNRLEEMCDDGFSQQELARAHDITLQEDDRFSYHMSVDARDKQFEDVNDVLLAGEEEDIIQMEPLVEVEDRVDQSIEIGRDAREFDADDALPPIDIDFEPLSKEGEAGSVTAGAQFDIVEDPIPLIDNVNDSASHTGNDQSMLGSVELSADLDVEINVAVKKSRKRKRVKNDRSTQIPSAEVMGKDTSRLVVKKTEFLTEPKSNLTMSTSGDGYYWLLASSDTVGPLAQELTQLITVGFRKGAPKPAVESTERLEMHTAEPVDDVVDVAGDFEEPQPALGDESAPVFDDATPMPEQDQPAFADDNDQRAFEESFISAVPHEDPLPDFTCDDEQQENDSSQPGGFSAWSDRTKKMCMLLLERLDKPDSKLTLQSLIEGKPRSTAAVIFLETLILKTYDFIDLGQHQPYGDIELKRASRFSDGAVAMADMVAISG